MKTYVVEIKGEAIVAFRADDDVHADELVNGEESEQGGIKTVLMTYARADGSMIWDGVTEINARRATDAEHDDWEQARDASIGDVLEGACIDLAAGEDLIPIFDPLEDDGVDEEAQRGRPR